MESPAGNLLAGGLSLLMATAKLSEKSKLKNVIIVDTFRGNSLVYMKGNIEFWNDANLSRGIVYIWYIFAIQIAPTYELGTPYVCTLELITIP